MKIRSVEQKLFEAFSNNRGLRLTANEVVDLMELDDAIRTRISNVAADEAGIEQPGVDCTVPSILTWKKLQEYIAHESNDRSN